MRKPQWEMHAVLVFHHGVDIQDVENDFGFPDDPEFDSVFVEADDSSLIEATFYTTVDEVGANQRFMQALRLLRDHFGIESIDSYEIELNIRRPEWELRVLLLLQDGADMQDVMYDIDFSDDEGFSAAFDVTEGSNLIDASFFVETEEGVPNQRFLQVIGLLREHSGVKSITSYNIEASD